MRIAIASSGLGHVARGIETWAASTAALMADRGVDVTLFSAADQPTASYERCLPSRRRSDPLVRRTVRWLPGFTWRWGWQSAYTIEQKSFWRLLQPELVKGDYDILHIQDPGLATYCRRARDAGQVRTREILGHGTEEPVEFLQQFPFVQHLAPWHLEQTVAALHEQLDKAAVDALIRHWRAIPNFVDTDYFAPVADHHTEFRQQAGLGREARVFCCAASVKVHHKRIDYLIREFSRYLEEAGSPNDYLFIAGSSNADSQALCQLAAELAGDHIRIFLDLPHEQMLEFYRTADAFVLTSLFEMMPIAVLEALAMGLPCMVHQHPVLEWMIGPGGQTVDMAAPGNLSSVLAEINAHWLKTHAQAAREHARQFAKETIGDQYLAYYADVQQAALPPVK